MHARKNPEPYSDSENETEALRQQAECCRRLAGATYDRHTTQILKQLADRFDRTAEELHQKPKRA